MTDNQGRTIDYLRISVTDRCNLRCVYCMPEEGMENIPHDRIMTYDEILRVCRILAEHGLKKIKITGGEPLVRKNVVWLIKELKKISGITNVTITTNGVLLTEQYEALVEAGIDAITVSLDTLDAEVYRQITRRDELSRVLEGIRLAAEQGKVRLKINCVPVLGTEKQGILELMEYIRNYDIDLRFIEMMPIGLGKQYEGQSEEAVLRELKLRFGECQNSENVPGNGPGHYYQFEGFCGKIGFISAVSHKFCDSCNRIRLISGGFLKPCLQYETGTDLKKLLRQNESEACIRAAIEDTIRKKPHGHQFGKKQDGNTENRMMWQIGG